jgi:signal transduction histidine kinase/DNA-binding response OmpR family regulator/HPt (histidine-containing phosphotransfer) domain-containing protein
MSAQAKLGSESRLKWCVPAAAAFAYFVGGLVLVGWAMDIASLKSLLPTWVTMKPNTAVCFVLAAVSLWLLRTEQANRTSRRIALACAFAVAVVGLLTLAEYCCGWDVGIDQLLFRELEGAVGTSSPGRMAPITALNFLLLGGALLLLDIQSRRGHWPAQYLAIMAGLFGLLGFLGYAYGVDSFSTLGAHTKMAMHTALSLVVLACGILLARRNRGLMAVVVSETAGGIVARRLLPVVVVLPVLLGWLRLKGQQAGLYDTETGVALNIVAWIAIFGVVVWFNAALLHRTDRERKRAEETIQLYADIEKNLPIGLNIWRLDDYDDPKSLRLLDANPAACSLTGVPMTDMRGMTFPEAFPGVSDTDLASYAEVVRSRKAKDIGVIEYHDERMAPAYWSIKAFPLPDRCVALAFENVTERRQKEEELQRMREQADAANQAKSQFLAHMSHEIRTPLNGILGFAELLRRGTRSEEQRAMFLDTIRSSGKHLLALIDEVLDLSKIEAGRMDFEHVRCSPHQVISEVLSTLRVASQQKGLSLECRWISRVPETIVTDPYRLRQLLMNVVGNAIKFTETGSVKLLVSVEAEKPEPRFLIEVHDTGIGIAANQLPRVFQPFNQADGTITRRFGGTGLGLAISQHIAHALGGEITIESGLGRGSVFRITLETGSLDGIKFLEEPPTEALTYSGKKKSRTKDLASARILLVEDGETNRDLIKLVLSEAGASVVCAENGQLGLETATRESFELILMDVQMPVMDGYTATRRLREQGCTTPIIALTAHAMRGDEQKCLDAGCTGYLTKPVDIDLLLRTVAEALTHTHSDGETSVDMPLEATDKDESDHRVVVFQADSAEAKHRGHQGPIRQLESTDAITSKLPTNRPEYRRIVENFVDKLQNKLDAMQVAFDAADLDELAELAHWLKGAGGTIGFDCFTEPARQLEQLAKRHETEQICDSIRGLNELASRIAVST